MWSAKSRSAVTSSVSAMVSTPFTSQTVVLGSFGGGGGVRRVK
jgi:hypothetical protein